MRIGLSEYEEGFADGQEEANKEIETLKRELAWAKDQWNKDRINLLSQLKTLNRDYRFMKDLAIGTEDLLKKASEK